MTVRIGFTDHALVRWLERTGAFDLAPLRAALEASLARAAGAAVKLEAGRFLIVADGLVYVVRDGVVVTVMEDGGPGARARVLAASQETQFP